MTSVDLKLKKMPTKLEEMATRAKSPQTYLNTVFLEDYRNAQRQRWMTENSSEGATWERLNPAYAAYKLKRYGGGPKYKTGKRGEGRWVPDGSWPSYPGGGRKMLIATGDLFQSVIGPGKGFNKIVTDRSIIIATSIDYAPMVNRLRPFMRFSQQRIKFWMAGYKKYISKGF